MKDLFDADDMQFHVVSLKIILHTFKCLSIY